MNREQKLETGILDLIKIYNDKGISLPPYNLYLHYYYIDNKILEETVSSLIDKKFLRMNHGEYIITKRGTEYISSDDFS
ncbi:MAG: hypothetical protein WCR24_02770 [Candidatus Methanomethylophilaceae archaeon]